MKDIRLLNRIALVAGIAAVLIALLLLLNYLQVKRADPLNTPALKTLTEKLKQDPANEQLRESIRELDLLARRAFFTSQWQIRTGGLILLLCLVIVLGSLQAADGVRKKNPLPDTPEKAGFFERQLLSRSWVLYSALFLAAMSLLVILLTRRSMEQELLTRLTTGDSTAVNALPEEMPAIRDTAGTPAMLPDTMKKDSSAVAAPGVSVATDDGYPSAAELKANFPAFRGVGGLGIVYHKNLPVDWDGKSGKNIRWKSPVPLPGFNSPVIWGDHLFLTGANDQKREVYCFDAGSGKLRWTTEIRDVPGSTGQVPKVNGETGQAAPSVATDGRRVYAIFANGNLAALDFSGRIVWSKNMGFPKNHYGHSSSLLTWRNLLIVQYDQTGNASVTAFHAASGQEAWKVVRNVRVSWASPILTGTGDDAQLILAADPYVISYHPATGKELWRNECISGEVGPSCAFGGSTVYSVNDYSKVAAIDIGSPATLRWEDDEYLSDIPSPVASSDFLFMVTSYGALVCYDAASGTKRWVHEFDHPVYASPVIAEGKLWVLAKNGTMHILRAGETYEAIANPLLGEGSVCTPAFSDGRIFIRGDRNLYCIGK